MGKMGVYRIKNVELNKGYIGQAENLSRRLRAHKNKLRRGNHKNHKLQEDWDKLGEESFQFEVVATVKKKYLLNYLEHYLMNKEKPIYNLYHSKVAPWGEKLNSDLEDLLASKIEGK